MTDSKSLASLPFGMSSRETGSRDSLPVVFLEIKQGRTAFPYRPVQGNRFLIGSASCCDLCLGSQSVPQLHSLLHIDKDDVVLEAVADFPLLKINGEIERSKSLCDGDVIEIGRFQLVARISSSFNTTPVEQNSPERLENVHTILEPIDDDFSAEHEADNEQLDGDLDSEHETDNEPVDVEPHLNDEVENESPPHEELSIHQEVSDEATEDELSIPESISDSDRELSAEELVDFIESEQRIVELFEERQQIGADALIQTVHKRAESLEDQSAKTFSVDSVQESIVSDDESVMENEAVLESDNESDPDSSPNIGTVPIEKSVEDVLNAQVQLHIHSEVENVLEQLHGLSEELDRRAERLSMRETGYAEAAACLLDAQYKLTTQLEKLVVRLGSLQADHSDDKKPHRAVA